jgi:hypothetical protein
MRLVYSYAQLTPVKEEKFAAHCKDTVPQRYKLETILLLMLKTFSHRRSITAFVETDDKQVNEI